MRRWRPAGRRRSTSCTGSWSKDDPRAWLWLGVALGLGMISKYTIVLLAAPSALFVLVDRAVAKVAAPAGALPRGTHRARPVLARDRLELAAGLGVLRVPEPGPAGGQIFLLAAALRRQRHRPADADRHSVLCIALALCRKQLTAGFAAPVAAPAASGAQPVSVGMADAFSGCRVRCGQPRPREQAELDRARPGWVWCRSWRCSSRRGSNPACRGC